MRLSTQIRNEHFSLDRYNTNSRASLNTKACSLYYLEYLFAMKALKAKFNGKVINNISGETIIKNAVKHLQGFITSECGISATRSYNSVEVNIPVLLSNNSFQTFLTETDLLAKGQFLRDEYFMAPGAAGAALNFNNSTTASSVLMRMLSSKLVATDFADITNRFSVNCSCRSVFGDGGYRTIVANQCAELSFSIQKQFFERPYGDNGYTTVLTSTGTILATDVFQIPKVINGIREAMAVIMGQFITDECIVKLDGITYIKFISSLCNSIMSIKSHCDSLFRNGCGNVTNNIIACTRNATNDTVAEMTVAIRQLYARLNYYLSKLIEDISVANGHYNSMRTVHPTRCANVYSESEIEIDFKKLEPLLMLLNYIVGYFSNVRSYTTAVMTVAGVNHLLDLLSLATIGDSVNRVGIEGLNTSVEELTTDFKNTLLAFDAVTSSKF
jgi:hypothetical protein